MIEDFNEMDQVKQILEKCGKYNYLQGTLICLTASFVVWTNLNFVFVAGNVNYRCKVPECESPDQPFTPNWWPNKDIDQCTRPILNLTLFGSSDMCTNQSFIEDVEICSEWVYETNDTVVAELNLACQVWKQNMIGTAHGIGMIIAMLVSGWASDRFGRKRTLITCSIGYVVGYFKLLVTSYNQYLAVEILEAAFSGGVFGSGAVLLTEITPTKYRMLAGVSFASAVYIGESLFSCFAMLAKNWRIFVLIIYSPCILCFALIFLLKESPRWLIVHGKSKEAKETLLLMAKMNEIEINVRELEKIDDIKLKQLFNLSDDVNRKREGFKEVFASLEMIKRLTMGFVTRFTVSFLYYGLLMNSVYLPGNKYTNFLFGVLASYPGEFLSLFVMSKFGRKLTLLFFIIFCGATSAAVDFIPDNYMWAKVLMFTIAKMLTAACFTGAITYTMEIFPTSVRGSLIGICTLATNIGNMLAPLIPSLKAVSIILPPLCYGSSALVSFGLLLLTPETSNLPLPDTIQQVDIKNKKVDKDTKNTKEKVSIQTNLGFQGDL